MRTKTLKEQILNAIPANRVKLPLFKANALSEGATLPTAGKAGYPPGAYFILTSATLGMCAYWMNVGTISSCLFVPAGPVLGYGFMHAGGPVDCTTGSTSQYLAQDFANPSDIAFAAHAVSNDTDDFAAVIAEAGKSRILATMSDDPLTAHDYFWTLLRYRCIPQWDVFAAGQATSVGGDTTETVTVTGARTSDLVFVTHSDSGDTDTIVSATISAANTLTITVSDNPSTTHEYSYVVLRPRGTFKPSHYVAYAGTHTTVGGSTAEAITVTGALATDIPLVQYNTTDDTDTIAKAVVTANTLTVTMSDNPAVAHALSYALLRAYA